MTKLSEEMEAPPYPNAKKEVAAPTGGDSHSDKDGDDLSSNGTRRDGSGANCGKKESDGRTSSTRLQVAATPSQHLDEG